MANFIKVKDVLFNTRMRIKSIDLTVGMSEPSGLACSYNDSRDQRAKLSYVAVFLEKILNGDVSVCRISGSREAASVYVEYNCSTGRHYCLVMADQTSPVYLRVLSDETDPRHAAGAIFTAILYSDEFCDAVTPKSAKEEFRRYFDPDAKQTTSSLNAYINKETYFYLCDLFYYAFAKWKNDAVFDLEDATTDENQAMIKRLAQSGAMEHVETTAPLELLNVTKKKEKKKAEQPSLFTEPLAEFFERCKKGEFLIRYNWSEKQKELIVPLSFLDSFYPTESFRLMLLSVWTQIKNVLDRIKGLDPSQIMERYTEIMGKNPINVKVMGKPGTGKTTVIEAVLASLGYPKGLINCKDRMEEDEIEGQNKFVNGSVWNIPTRAGQLHSVGGAVVLEEFNLPDPGILQGALGQALAFPFILKEDGYKELKRHPLTIYFATMNIGTCGSKPMNEALSSRFPEGYVIEDVPEDEFVGILADAGYKKTDCRKVYRVYTKILNYLREYNPELSLSITLRHCLNALDKMKIGFSEEQAYTCTFLSQLYASDPEIASEVKEAVFKAVV